MNYKCPYWLIFLAISLPACTWVKPTSEGEKVRVLSAEEVSTCKKMGTTSVSLKADIAGFDRNEEKVSKELAMLARNSAPDLGGDTVVPASDIKQGKQDFAVYKCVAPK